MKTCICDSTEIMWSTHRVGVTADNIVRYTASSLTVLHTLWCDVATTKEKFFCLLITCRLLGTSF